MQIDNLSDRDIVHAILSRDTVVTREYLYRKCFPLFKSLYDRYYTNCASVVEFINEIYVYLLYPAGKEKRSKLEGFAFGCSLTGWLKVVAANYCYQAYSRRVDVDYNFDWANDRSGAVSDSLLTDAGRGMDGGDLRKVLALMPNQRFARLIEYRYIDGCSHQEAARRLQMTMTVYYNSHKRAKEQMRAILRRERLI